MSKTYQYITEFSGDNSWLSNFYQAPVEFDGVIWKTAEHAYQAAKTNIDEERQAIAGAYSPGRAKKMGRRVTLRHDWEEVKVEIMHNILVQKFTNTELAELLIATGDAHLVEGNTWGDKFWGVCDGRGHNTLGKLLMQVRDDLVAKYGSANQTPLSDATPITQSN